MIESIIETPRPASAPGVRQQQEQLRVDCYQPYLPRSRDSATSSQKPSEVCYCASDQKDSCDHWPWVMVQDHRESKQDTHDVDQQYDQHQ